MAERYPLFLDLAGRPCLVVGGGPVAARKVAGLSGAGADITVVAPEAVAPLAEAAAAGALRWERRGYREADLEGRVLAFAVTSDPGVNRAVADAGRRRGVWVNRADDPADGDFHVPAVLRRGRVTVAVGTGGTSPVLATWTRDRVADALPSGLAGLGELAGALGQRVAADTGAYRALFSSGVAEDLGRRDWPEVERKVMDHFGHGDAVREVLRGLRSEER